MKVKVKEVMVYKDFAELSVGTRVKCFKFRDNEIRTPAGPINKILLREISRGMMNRETTSSYR